MKQLEMNEQANPHHDKHCERSIALISRGMPGFVAVEQYIAILYRWGIETYRTGSEGCLEDTLERIEKWEATNPDE